MWRWRPCGPPSAQTLLSALRDDMMSCHWSLWALMSCSGAGVGGWHPRDGWRGSQACEIPEQAEKAARDLNSKSVRANGLHPSAVDTMQKTSTRLCLHIYASECSNKQERHEAEDTQPTRSVCAVCKRKLETRQRNFKESETIMMSPSLKQPSHTENRLILHNLSVLKSEEYKVNIT